MVFDSKCGENPLTLESIAPEDPPRDLFNKPAFVLPEHNRVVFRMDGTNATCDWSYAIEIELEETSAAVHQVSLSSLLVAIIATLAHHAL